MNVGVISDTHGLLRVEAVKALEPCELILHAGDVGSRDILDDLMDIAPVVAVRGNVDGAIWARSLCKTEAIEAGSHFFYMVHDIGELDIDPVASQISVVIYGHSHLVRCERKAGVLYLNPGSAGPRRFHLPVTVARIEMTPDAVEATVVELEI